MLQKPDWDLNEVGKALWGAAAYMEEHGHCKKTLRNNDGHVCLNGALMMTVGFNGLIHKECIESLAQAKGITGDHWFNKEHKLVLWNNLPETTGEDVINLFRQAAITCKVTA